MGTDSDNLFTFVLAGGSGNRLWPYSTKKHPKPFLSLLGDKTPFDETVRRAKHVAGRRTYLIANSEHREHVEKSVARNRIPPCQRIYETVSRNTAFAAAIATKLALDSSKGACVLLLPSDHAIDCNLGFQQTIEQAVSQTLHCDLALVSIQPERADTEFGYVQLNERQVVLGFHEKPERYLADHFLKSGDFRWNSGIFAFRATRMAELMSQLAPDIWKAAKGALRFSRKSPEGCYLHAKSSSGAENVSFDRAIVERLKDIISVSALFGWNDLGTWENLDAIPCGSANSDSGPVSQLIDSNNVSIFSRDFPVRVEGLSDVHIAASTEGLLLRKKEIGTPEQFSQWLNNVAMPFWLTHGIDHECGNFHELLKEDGKPVCSDKKLRTQARQTFAFAAHFNQTGDINAKRAAELGTATLKAWLDTALLAKNLPEDWPQQGGPSLFDLSMVLLAAAEIERVAPVRASQLSLKVFNGLRKLRLADFRGLYRHSTASDRNDVRAEDHMHLLDALLLWNRRSPHAAAQPLVTELIDAFYSHFYDEMNWVVRERPFSDQPDLWSPGHHFEWAINLRQANGDIEVAHRLAAKAVTFGPRAEDSLFALECSRNQNAAGGSTRFWVQLEAIRYLAEFGEDAVSGADLDTMAALTWKHHIAASQKAPWLDWIGTAGAHKSAIIPASELYHAYRAVCAYQNASNAISKPGHCNEAAE